MIRFSLPALSLSAVMALTAPAMATECIAPAGPGGGWDFTCRQIGRILYELGAVPSPVQVTNMAGAGGGVAYTHVVSERADDADLIVAASSATTTRLAANAFAGMTADQVRWVGTIAGDPGVIVVAANSPFQTLNDLIAAVQADPGSVAFAGGSAVGGYDHVKVLMMMSRGGFTDARAIRYVGLDNGADAITQTIGGFTQAMTGDISEIGSYIAAGEVRALAVLSPERVAGYDIPTAREQGIDLVAMNWRGLYAPHDITDEQFHHWSDALRQVADSAQWQQVMADNGLAPYTLVGDDFQAWVDANIAETQGILRAIGIIQ